VSKWTKLLRDPRRFVLDSKAYRRVSLLRNQGLGLGERRSTGPLVGGVDTSHVEDMARWLAERVPMLDITDRNRMELAVLREHLHHLSAGLHELGHRGDLGTAQISSRAGDLDVEGVSLLALDDLLASTDRFEVRGRSPDGDRFELGFQLWETERDQVVGPVANRVARRISHATVAELGFFRKGELRTARELHARPLTTEVTFPVDVVFTWVNDSDPHWQALYRQAMGAPPSEQEDDAHSIDRFMNRDELMYSLRSIAEFAPWVRKVFVVTNCAPPDWIDVDGETLVWVDHREIIPERFLPTFSSHAIESRLQHVPGLADHFLYFNDDFFLMRQTSAVDFFHGNGLSRAFLEPYGVVSGEVAEGDPDYLNAARNGKRLLEDTFEKSATNLHKHTPYALRRDVLLEMEERFATSINPTTARAFRTAEDISTVSFLYHHYAFLTGRAAYSGRNAALIKAQTPRYEKKLQRILSGRGVPFSLCLNDGGGSFLHPHWGQHVVEFLSAYFPEKSKYEK
jgi:hypothetical protein